MEVDPVDVRPLNAAGEDALVAYRLQHPENAARLFSSAWNTANSPTTTPELSDLRASKQETYQEASDIEALRYVGAIKRLLKANEVQVQQAALFEKQKEAIVAQRQAELLALEQEKNALEAERRKKESFKKCDTLAKEIAGKKQGRVQLDGLIRQVTEQLEEEQQRKQAFLAEASQRKERFTEIGESLTSILAMDKVDPTRSSADIPKLQTLPSKPLTNRPTAPSLSRAGTLDPKAATFTPSAPTATSQTRSGPQPTAGPSSSKQGGGRPQSLREQFMSQEAVAGSRGGSRAASRTGSRAVTPAPASKESGEISISSAATSTEDAPKSSPTTTASTSKKAAAAAASKAKADSRPSKIKTAASSSSPVPPPGASSPAPTTVDQEEAKSADGVHGNGNGTDISRNGSLTPLPQSSGLPSLGDKGGEQGEEHEAAADVTSELSSLPGTREGTMDPTSAAQAGGESTATTTAVAGPPPKVTGKRTRGGNNNANKASVAAAATEATNQTTATASGRQTRSSSRGRKPTATGPEAPSSLPRLRSQSRGSKRGGDNRKDSRASSPTAVAEAAAAGTKQESIAEEDEEGSGAGEAATEEEERTGRTSKRRKKGGK